MSHVVISPSDINSYSRN